MNIGLRSIIRKNSKRKTDVFLPRRQSICVSGFQRLIQKFFSLSFSLFRVHLFYYVACIFRFHCNHIINLLLLIITSFIFQCAKADNYQTMKPLVVSKSALTKLLYSLNPGSYLEGDAANRIHECAIIMAEEILQTAMESSRIRKSKTIEKCDIEAAIDLMK